MHKNLTGLVLAGGHGSRMGGVDKGLVLYNNHPLITYAINAVAPYTDKIIISANRSIERYKDFGYEVHKDTISGGLGPLAGIHTGLTNCETEYLISVPCDTPFLSQNFIESLVNFADENDCKGVIPFTKAKDGKKLFHPTIMLVKTRLMKSLADYLNNGGRKIKIWTDAESFCEFFFDDDSCFENFNTLDQLKKRSNS